MQVLCKTRNLVSEFKTSTGCIDTSLLIEELKRDFKRKGVPIEVNFRDIIFWLKLGDQLTHQIHPYPAKLLPHIANLFVNASKLQKGGDVLDPFCGSGTVALEASISGSQALIVDANPFARLIALVKTTPYDTDTLLELTAELIAKTKRFKSAPNIEIINSELWYLDDVKRNLEKLLRAINQIESAFEREFFLLCFSVVARRMSFTDPSISVPVRLKEKASLGPSGLKRVQERMQWLKKADYLEVFSSVCLANINRVLKTNKKYPNRKRAIVVGDDACDLQRNDSKNYLGRNSADLILTSPPYGSAQKYIRSVSLSLNWLGLATPKELAVLEKKSIGRERVSKRCFTQLVDLSSKYEDFIKSTQALNVTRAEITRAYLSEMKIALTEMTKAINSGGRIVIVIGNNDVCGRSLKNDEFVQEIMHANGFETELYLRDQIKSRGLLSKRNSSAPIITHESILMFRGAQ